MLRKLQETAGLSSSPPGPTIDFIGTVDSLSPGLLPLPTGLCPRSQSGRRHYAFRLVAKDSPFFANLVVASFFFSYNNYAYPPLWYDAPMVRRPSSQRQA